MKTLIAILLLLSGCASRYPDYTMYKKWTSINDVLPDKSGNYLVWVIKYRPDGTTIEHHSIVWYSEYLEGESFNIEPLIEPYTRFVKAEVSHWAPLPEPPNKWDNIAKEAVKATNENLKQKSND